MQSDGPKYGIDWAIRGFFSALGYWAVILWMLFFAVNSLGTCIMAAFIGKKWVMLDTQDRFLIIVAIATNFAGTMAAFIYKAKKKMELPN